MMQEESLDCLAVKMSVCPSLWNRSLTCAATFGVEPQSPELPEAMRPVSYKRTKPRPEGKVILQVNGSKPGSYPQEVIGKELTPP